MSQCRMTIFAACLTVSNASKRYETFLSFNWIIKLRFYFARFALWRRCISSWLFWLVVDKAVRRPVRSSLAVVSSLWQSVVHACYSLLADLNDNIIICAEEPGEISIFNDSSDIESLERRRLSVILIIIIIIVPFRYHIGFITGCLFAFLRFFFVLTLSFAHRFTLKNCITPTCASKYSIYRNGK